MYIILDETPRPLRHSASTARQFSSIQYLATMVKSPKTELVRAGCIEDVEDCGTYTLRMREVNPTHTVVLLNGMVILRE